MIIFINGSINSGKSTVSKILAKKIGNCAVIEVDELRNFVAWMPLQDSISLNWENACLLIKNFVQHDIHVIVPYPLSQQNYELVMRQLADSTSKLYFFTLSPTLEVALTNRGNRELDEWEVNRIKYHYEIGIHKPSFGEVIDNSKQTAQDTADVILQAISKQV